MPIKIKKKVRWHLGWKEEPFLYNVCKLKSCDCITMNYYTEVAKLHIDKFEICAYYCLCCVIHWITLNVGLKFSFVFSVSDFLYCVDHRIKEARKQNSTHIQVYGSQFASSCFRFYISCESYQTRCFSENSIWYTSTVQVEKKVFSYVKYRKN